MFVVLDTETHEATKVNRVYVWKVGPAGAQRLYETEVEATQALVDYLKGPWAQTGGPSEIIPGDFAVVEYNGTLTEDDLASTEHKGCVTREEIGEGVRADKLVQKYGITATVEDALGDQGWGFAAVLKEDYNGAKLTGGANASMMIWITGPEDNKRRIYSTPEEAREGLEKYLEEDWDGEVHSRQIGGVDFVIVKVLKPGSILQPTAKGSGVELSQILHDAKAFNQDDSLF